MNPETNIYDEVGVRTLINAEGPKTRLSGPLIRKEAADAMREAAKASAHISDLQAAASEIITDLTGAEAGYVTSGASAALTLAAAACIAGDDLEIMAQLPEAESLANELVIPRVLRNGYDRAFSTGGAAITDVGNSDHTLGIAVSNVEPWELDGAISEDTAAVGYLPRPGTGLALETVTEIAHTNGVPVIVDAAASVPPRSNMTRFINDGADLVAFSGGKMIRGPQSTGILAGRQNLIQSAALQHLDMDVIWDLWDPPENLINKDEIDGVPRHGLGRGFKVGKEDIVGLIRALELFAEEDESELQLEWQERARLIARELEGVPGLEISIQTGYDNDQEYEWLMDHVPVVEIKLDEGTSETESSNLVRSLRNEDPRVFIGARELEAGLLSVNPLVLSKEESAYVARRIAANLPPDE